jgi:hypothetical protein
MQSVGGMFMAGLDVLRPPVGAGSVVGLDEPGRAFFGRESI